MRIGTWNLNTKWTKAHQEYLGLQQCDVWLQTEVNAKARDASGRTAKYHRRLSTATMARGQHYAAILSLSPLNPLPDPHAASAAAVVDGITYCANILPWAGCAKHAPSLWVGPKLEDRARAAIDQLTTAMPKSNMVWGGDWNQNLTGGWQNVGSSGVRVLVESAVSVFGLRVATTALPHKLGSGRYTIDHIAVPLPWKIRGADRIGAGRLSDHDAYVVEVDRDAAD